MCVCMYVYKYIFLDVLINFSGEHTSQFRAFLVVGSSFSWGPVYNVRGETKCEKIILFFLFTCSSMCAFCFGCSFVVVV